MARSPRTRKPELSIKDIRFAQGVAAGKTLKQAYLDAGFAAKVTDNATQQAAWSLLKNPKNSIILDYVHDLQDAAAETAKITMEDMARSLREQAFADRTQVFNDDGSMKLPKDWPQELRSIIAGIEVDNIEEWTKDPDTGERVKTVIGQNWKVKFERSTEAKKILAEWRGIGGSKVLDADRSASNPVLVIELGREKVEQPPVDEPEFVEEDGRE